MMREVSAGAVLYTRVNGQVRYLLVLEKPGHFGFPKGHLEQGETEIDAALREIREECGIEATLRTEFRQVLTYPVRGHSKDNIYFTACYRDQIPRLMNTEVDGVLLVTFEKALELLTFDNSRQLLRNAHRWIKENPEV